MTRRDLHYLLIVAALAAFGLFLHWRYTSACEARHDCPPGYKRVASTRPLMCACVETESLQ